MEQAAQASRVTTMYADAEQQIFTLEGMVRDAKAKTEEYAQLLSDRPRQSTLWKAKLPGYSRLSACIVKHMAALAF